VEGFGLWIDGSGLRKIFHASANSVKIDVIDLKSYYSRQVKNHELLSMCIEYLRTEMPGG
jgi:hypothetical protein